MYDNLLFIFFKPSEYCVGERLYRCIFHIYKKKGSATSVLAKFKKKFYSPVRYFESKGIFFSRTFGFFACWLKQEQIQDQKLNFSFSLPRHYFVEEIKYAFLLLLMIKIK